MKYSKSIALVGGLLLALSIYGQQPSKPHVMETGGFEMLSWTIFFAAEKHDVETAVRKTEFILMFLEIDSNGFVSQIHLMDDQDNRDSTYAALRKVKPEELKGWSNKKYKNKVLILPIESYRRLRGDKDRTYLEKAGIGYLPMVFTNSPNSNYLLMPRFYYDYRGGRFIDESRSKSSLELPKIEMTKNN